MSVREGRRGRGARRGGGWGAGLGFQGLEVDCFRRDTNVRFSAELRRLQSLPKCERLPLPSFLLLPFQRITRLRMLLQVPVRGWGGRGVGGEKWEALPPPQWGTLPSSRAACPAASQSRTPQAHPELSRCLREQSGCRESAPS